MASSPCAGGAWAVPGQHPPLSVLCQPCSDHLLAGVTVCCAHREGRDGSLCEAELCWEQRQLERRGRDFLCRLSLAGMTPSCETLSRLAGGRNRCGRAVTEFKGDSSMAGPSVWGVLGQGDREVRGECGTGPLGTICDRGGGRAAEMGEMRRRAWGGHPEQGALCWSQVSPLSPAAALHSLGLIPSSRAQPSCAACPGPQHLLSLWYEPSKVWWAQGPRCLTDTLWTQRVIPTRHMTHPTSWWQSYIGLEKFCFLFFHQLPLSVVIIKVHFPLWQEALMFCVQYTEFSHHKGNCWEIHN